MQYKWEVYFGVSLSDSSRLRSPKCTASNWGVYSSTNWRSIAVLYVRQMHGSGFITTVHKGHRHRATTILFKIITCTKYYVRMQLGDRSVGFFFFFFISLSLSCKPDSEDQTGGFLPVLADFVFCLYALHLGVAWSTHLCHSGHSLRRGFCERRERREAGGGWGGRSD